MEQPELNLTEEESDKGNKMGNYESKSCRKKKGAKKKEKRKPDPAALPRPSLTRQLTTLRDPGE